MNSTKTPKRKLFGLYWRKLLFFAGIFSFTALFYWQISYFKADMSEYSPVYQTSSLSVVVNVLGNGSITIDNKKVRDKVSPVDGKEEVRLPVLDNIGIYYSNATITLNLPRSVADKTTYDIKGIHGVGSVSSYVKSGNQIVYEADDVQPTATISIIAQMPQGTVNFPLIVRLYSLLNNIKSNSWMILGISLPLLTWLYLLLFIAYQIRRQAIDSPKKGTNAPPMALPPAVVGVLIRQKVGPREIAATLIDLALRGDIMILDRERDFAFVKNKYDQRLLSFEKILLSKIFRQNLVSGQREIEERINNHLYSKKISAVTAGIYALATRLGYFQQNPQSVHHKYQIIGIVGTMIGLSGIALSLITFRDPPYIVFFWIGMTLSTIIIAALAKRIPIRTILGQEALSNWIAFKQYLSSREKLPFSYENQETFQRYLPYAVILDCEVAWAKRFSEQNFVLPEWFVSSRTGLGLEDFCLSLFPIVSYVSRSFAAIREPGFK